jgi:hypothetical protein
VLAIHPEKSVDLVQDLVCAWSQSCSSSQSYNNYHVNQDDCKPSAAPLHGYLYSTDKDDGHCHRPDKNNSVFATFSAPKAKKSAFRNRELRL